MINELYEIEVELEGRDRCNILILISLAIIDKTSLLTPKKSNDIKIEKRNFLYF